MERSVSRVREFVGLALLGLALSSAVMAANLAFVVTVARLW
jgi:hypothetical protein